MKYFKYAASLIRDRKHLKPLVIDDSLGSGGSYSYKSKRIRLGSSAKAPMYTHELTHWAQDRKGQLSKGHKISLTGIAHDLKNETGAYYKQTQRSLAGKGIPVKSMKSKIISRVVAPLAAPFSTFNAFKGKTLLKALTRLK